MSALRQALPKAVRELRLFGCQQSPASEGVRCALAPCPLPLQTAIADQVTPPPPSRPPQRLHQVVVPGRQEGQPGPAHPHPRGARHPREGLCPLWCVPLSSTPCLVLLPEVAGKCARGGGGSRSVRMAGGHLVAQWAGCVGGTQHALTSSVHPSRTQRPRAPTRHSLTPSLTSSSSLSPPGPQLNRARPREAGLARGCLVGRGGRAQDRVVAVSRSVKGRDGIGRRLY